MIHRVSIPNTVRADHLAATRGLIFSAQLLSDSFVGHSTDALPLASKVSHPLDDFELVGRRSIRQPPPFEPGNTEYWVQRVGGADFGWHDATAIVTAFYLDRTPWVTQVHHGTRMLAEQHVQGVEGGHTYYCDPSGTQARQELAQACSARGIEAHFQPAPRSKGELKVDFTDAEWALVAGMVRDGRVKILRTAAAQLLLEARHFRYNPTTGLPDRKRGGDWGHFDCLDALRYCCMGAETGGSCDMVSLGDIERRIGRREDFLAW